MKILVTGAAGFIGGNFCHFMTKKYPNDMIYGLDSLTYAGNIKTIESLMDLDNFEFIRADITDRSNIYSLFELKSFDLVINFAAESHVDRSIKYPEIFLKTNILGTQVLMDACIKYGNIRFHQISTDEVYGDLPLDRPDLLFTENTPIHTSSPYSSSKASADLLVNAYYRTYNLPVTISRCSNNYGPFQFPEKLIPLMINKITNKTALPVYGNGQNVRDWLHVYDHCTAIDLIVRKGKIGQVYNIGGNNEKSNIEIVNILINLLDGDHSLITYVKDRKGHDLRYAIDSTRIKTELGWKPKYNFDSGIKETVEWYKSNSDWIESIINGEYLDYLKKFYD